MGRDVQLGLSNAGQQTGGRTLIEQLGFADPDRKSSRHDAACQYLISAPTRAKLKRGAPDWVARTEAPVEQLGSRDFRRAVGFADVVFFTPSSDECECDVFEVKIAKVPLGDVVRQLKTYACHAILVDIDRRMYLRATRQVVVTDYDLNGAELDSLKNEGIEHLRLGRGFEEFLATINRKATQTEI